MKTYLIRRLLLVIPTFLGISIITFAVVQLSPGSPVSLRLAQIGGAMDANEAATEETIRQIKELYGLDKPIPVQYVLWLKRMVVLDFGESFKDRRPVLDKILDALPITLELNLISFFLIYAISVPIGVMSAVKQDSKIDAVITSILFMLYSLPSFGVAMLCIYFLAGGQFVNWFPAAGMNSLGHQDFGWGKWIVDHAWHIALPILCLTYAGLAQLSRFARAGMIETIRQDYVRTARAYGFSEKVVIFKYALRNSLIPILTLLGTLLPAMLSGSVIIENIFSIPGMGRLAFESILSRDYPLIMGIVSFSAFLTLVGLIISDILYAITDPRVRLQ